MVIVPTLPVMITMIITNLLITERSYEKLQYWFTDEPNESPTVPSAEKISNKAFKGAGLSKSMIRKNAPTITEIDKDAITNDLYACSMGTLFLSIVISLP